VFVLKENETKIEFVFKQSVNDIVRALCEYQGRLLAGVGNSLVLYDIGKNHLLKKCECKKITSTITKIQTNGQRILLSTINESFYFLRHKTNENQFYIFADDVIPRWLTAAIFIDYDTIAGADKFENFFIYRLPPGADEENKNDPMSSQKKWEVGYLHGAAYKLNLIAQYHVGDLITALCKTSLKGGDDNIICYCTSSGRIGVFMPFETREEVDFFIHLEMYLRIEIDNVVGREHQMFRSCYGPVKCVIDGDLCEEYFSMESEKQKQLTKDLDKNKNEVLNSLLDIRNKII
jgi:splicing factor 3B subunit 3